MTWFDDLGAFTYGTGTTTVGAGVPAVYYDKKFLELLTERLIMMRFAQLRPLPEGNGKTIEFSRPRPLSPNITALTEGVNPNATQINWQKIQVALKEYGDWAQVSSLAKQTHLDQDILGAVEIFAAQAAESTNLLLTSEVAANGIYPLTADQSSTSTFSGTIAAVTSTVAFTGGAALEANSPFGDADDDLNQAVLVMTSGPAKGEARPVTDYDADGGATGTAASGAMTFTKAFNMTPEVGDSFVVTTPDEITTGDDLSYANLKAARTLLVKFLATPFQNGLFAAVLGPDQLKNLADDTDWKNLQTYKEKTKGLSDLMFTPFAGFAIYEHTTPFAFPVETRGTAGTGGGPGNEGGNYAVGGAVQVATCFGKNAFGASSFRKKSGQMMNPPVHVKYPNQYDKSDPLDRYCAVGWVLEMAMKSLYAPHCVGIFTSAA